MNPTPSRLEQSAFYSLLVGVVLTPLVFWSSTYAPLELAKTIIIVATTLISAILLAIVVMKEKKTICAPRPIFWTGALLALSVVLSALLSGHIGKSFFGQGFEAGTASFILILFVAACVTFKLVRRDLGRAVVLYAGMTAAFIILYAFHLLRLFAGPGFASLGILSQVTSTVFGSWFSLAAFAAVILLVAVSALLFLPLSRRLRILYWVLAVLAAAGIFIVNDVRVWAVAAIIFLGLTIIETSRRVRASGTGSRAIFSRLAWVPAIAFVIAAVLVWKGNAIAGPIVSKLGASYVDSPTLSWRGTLDVGAGAMKSAPLFGIGPNRFSSAYLNNKPADVNVTNAWNLEFISAMSTLTTFVVTEGVVGTILWILFFIFLGIAGARALKRLPEDPQNRFIIVSSFASTVFLWFMAAVSILPQTLLLMIFVMTGIFLASAVVSGSLVVLEIPSAPGNRISRLMPVAAIVCIIVVLAWGAVYIKKFVALSYFASGVKELTAAGGDATKADADFAAANSWDRSDIYLQARAEAGITEASNLVSSLNNQTPTATSQATLTQAASLITTALGYANDAIAYDPSNYYNYVSKARVASAGARLQAPNAYDVAVQSYVSAIQLNPTNPSLYLTLAQLQASNNKLDDALQTVGAAIRVKNNYLDAVFLLSQIEAAKGNLADAITAAIFAAQLNPQSPIIFFQLGLLEYQNKSYGPAADAFTAAIKLQPDYANAAYFLGLSDIRLGKMSDALAVFQSLAASNPDNQQVLGILHDLQIGKSPFADAQQSAASAPEKGKSLPIKQKQ